MRRKKNYRSTSKSRKKIIRHVYTIYIVRITKESPRFLGDLGKKIEVRKILNKNLQQKYLQNSREHDEIPSLSFSSNTLS